MSKKQKNKQKKATRTAVGNQQQQQPAVLAESTTANESIKEVIAERKIVEQMRQTMKNWRLARTLLSESLTACLAKLTNDDVIDDDTRNNLTTHLAAESRHQANCLALFDNERTDELQSLTVLTNKINALAKSIHAKEHADELAEILKKFAAAKGGGQGQVMSLLGKRADKILSDRANMTVEEFFDQGGNYLTLDELIEQKRPWCEDDLELAADFGNACMASLINGQLSFDGKRHKPAGQVFAALAEKTELAPAEDAENIAEQVIAKDTPPKQMSDNAKKITNTVEPDLSLFQEESVATDRDDANPSATERDNKPALSLRPPEKSIKELAASIADKARKTSPITDKMLREAAALNTSNTAIYKAELKRIADCGIAPTKFIDAEFAEEIVPWKDLNQSSFIREINDVVRMSDRCVGDWLSVILRHEVFTVESLLSKSGASADSSRRFESKARSNALILINFLLKNGIIGKITYKSRVFYVITGEGHEFLQRPRINKLYLGNIKVNGVTNSADWNELSEKKRRASLVRSCLLNEITAPMGASSDFGSVRINLSGVYNYAVLRLTDDYGAKYVVRATTLLLEERRWRKELCEEKSETILELAAANAPAILCVEKIFLFVAETEDNIQPWLDYIKNWPMRALVFIPALPTNEDDITAKRQEGILLDADGNRYELTQFFKDLAKAHRPVKPNEKITALRTPKNDGNANGVSVEKNSKPNTKQDKRTAKEKVAATAIAPAKPDDTGAEETAEMHKIAEKGTRLAEIAIADAKTKADKLAAQLIADDETTPKLLRQKIVADVEMAGKLFVNGFAADGLMWLHSLRDMSGDKRAAEIVLEVGFILDDPLVKTNLQTVDTFNFADYPTDAYDGTEPGLGGHYLHLAALIKNFYNPKDVHSYQLENRWKQLNDDRGNEILRRCPEIKQLVELFRKVAVSTNISFAYQLKFACPDDKEDAALIENALAAQTEHIKAAVNIKISNVQMKNMAEKMYRRNGLITPYFVDAKNKPVPELTEFCRQFSLLDLTDTTLNVSALPDEEIISADLLGDYVDAQWNSSATHARKSEKFTGRARNNQINLLTKALAALVRYVMLRQKNAKPQATQQEGIGSGDRQKCLDLIAALKQNLTANIPVVPFEQIGYGVLNRLLDKIAADVRGEAKQMPLYAPLLLGKDYIELNGDAVPQTDNFRVAEFRLRERLVSHSACVLSVGDTKEAAQDALKSAFSRHDLGQVRLLAKFYPAYLETTAEDIEKSLRAGERVAEREFDGAVKNFLGNLELDYNYGRITDKTRTDFYIEVAETARKHFENTGNLGIYKSFLAACREGIDKLSRPHRLELLKRYESLAKLLAERLNNERNGAEVDADVLAEHEKKKNDILRIIKEQIDLGNLTVAEDYINRSEAGDYLELSVTSAQNEELTAFLEDHYQKYYGICTKQRAKSLALNNIYEQMQHGSHNRKERDAAAFIDCWRDLKNPANIKELLAHLSYGNVNEIKSAKNGDVTIFKVTFNDDGKQQQKYAHPFAVFGTDCRIYGLEVIVLLGNRSADGIAEALKQSLNTGSCGHICVADCALALAERRKLAQLMKTIPDLKNIVVLDRVLALYLTQFEDNVRGERFLRLAIPFAQVQPYTASSVVPPEMFVGREREMQDIMNMRGSVLVYGGRQLGKSDLLQQTRSLMHRPVDGKYALLVTLKGCDTQSALAKIGHELVKNKLLKKIPADWDEFYRETDILMTDGLAAKPFTQLMLLMDEADSFLDAAAAENNRPVEVLKDLMESHSGRFKFVLAGLHRVIYFGNNTVFGQLGHITIRPFNYTEAYELLLKPMSYMGFAIGSPAIAGSIFARANYFPGLIQYYCKMLVDAASDNYKQNNFNSVNNPPYVLDDEYLKRMMNDGDFQQEINRKFQITLELGTDNYYDIIALALVVHCHYEGRITSVTPQNIREVCDAFSVTKITDLTDERLSALMSEMAELNILRMLPDESKDRYVFNQYTFFSMMGTIEEVEEKLTKYGEEG